jgi:hypothetical protein
MKSTVLIPLTSLFLFSACQKSAESTITTSEAAAVSLEAWFTDTPPADPAAIHVLRTTAKPGDTVTISGLVMGRMQPFVDGRAAFILGDPAKLTPCNRKPGDECETPWDVCCDTEAISEATATIQLMGEDGRVLRQSIKGSHGLAELSEVTLTGTVDKASTAEALIINATLMHVGPQP